MPLIDRLMEEQWRDGERVQRTVLTCAPTIDRVSTPLGRPDLSPICQ